MTKIRTIKPDFFRHEGLFEAEQSYQLPLRIAFAGLLTCCDRAGRFRWRPKQLKLDVLPYDAVDFEKLLNALHETGFIKKYEKDGEYYGYIPSWHKHQTINTREPESKLPDPSTGTHVQAQTASELSTLINTKQDSIQIIASQNSLPIYTEQVQNRDKPMPISDAHVHAHETQVPAHLEVELEMEGKWKGSGTGREVSTPVHCTAAPTAELPPVITLPLNDKSEFPIAQSQIDEWQTLYPAIDVVQELRHIRGWNLANPKKRKTQSGILKHITSWLAKEQNKGGNLPNSTSCSSHTPHYAPRASPTNSLFEQNVAAGEEWLNPSPTKTPIQILDGETLYDSGR